jgi:hypothetical protein
MKGDEKDHALAFDQCWRACRTGVCHRCETALMTGAVNYAPSPIDLPGDGNLLICCSQPQGDIVVDL